MRKLIALSLLAAPLAHSADLPSVSPTAETGRRAEAGFPMVDPTLDDPNKPWCYFTHPTSCIGVPWMPGLNLQITPEGNLFTNFAELALFWGPENKPLASRQRQFLNGWIPIIRDSWKDGDLTYDYEVFGAVKDISSVRIVPYYGRTNRFYQFVVRTSTDGNNWNTYLDLSQNTKTIGVEGASYTGQPTPVRYIHVEMLKNSANEWMQLVEVHAR